MSNSYIGREKETQQLLASYNSKTSQLVILTGRRRVGKTFLIDNIFQDKFTFRLTGAYKKSKATQLEIFKTALEENGFLLNKALSNWEEAFKALRQYLESLPKNYKKVVFIDEMPWLDSQKSDFLSTFENFWNSYGAKNNELMFIVCGSATSWITNKILNNKGGLFNRFTLFLFLKPFTLKETKQYLLANNIFYSDYDIAQLYMIMGGIPYYLSFLSKEFSLGENIDNLFFNRFGSLAHEFDNLYRTMFSNNEQYIKIVEELSKKRMGMTRDELSKATKIANNGNFSKMLNNLYESDFIDISLSYADRKIKMYRLVDFYTFFYFKFLKDNYGKEEHFWSKSYDSPTRRSYLGFSFELLCYTHLNQIKKAIGIDDVLTNAFSWSMKPTSKEDKGAQIDLVLDRKDKSIDIIECKYSLNPYVIDKSYYASMQNKIEAFAKFINYKKSLRIVFLTINGVHKNEYYNIVNKVVTIKDLFD